jgi:hypothetical protein
VHGRIQARGWAKKGEEAPALVLTKVQETGGVGERVEERERGVTSAEMRSEESDMSAHGGVSGVSHDVLLRRRRAESD